MWPLRRLRHLPSGPSPLWMGRSGGVVLQVVSEQKFSLCQKNGTSFYHKLRTFLNGLSNLMNQMVN